MKKVLKKKKNKKIFKNSQNLFLHTLKPRTSTRGFKIWYNTSVMKFAKIMNGNLSIGFLFSMSIIAIGLIFSSATILKPVIVQAQTQEIQRDKLQAELDALEKDIAQKQADLDSQRKQTGSIKRDVSILQNEIAKDLANIKAKTIVLGQLSQDINLKNKTITVLGAKLSDQKVSLTSLIQKVNEIDALSLENLVLSSDSLSDFYGDLESISNMNLQIQNSLGQIKSVRSQTQIEKQSLENKQNSELNAKNALEKSKKQIETNKSEKAQLLKLSQNKEAGYQKVLAERQARAATIRATLFNLRDTGAIPFGTALTYAQEAQKKTGVRPAFLLAIMTQESNLGKNVGSCYLTDPDNGSGIIISSGKAVKSVMKPSRDVTPFMDITKALGRDPFKTRVSCPLSYGYGGGMGPAQFIASTWKMMESKIARVAGVAHPDPWSPHDAIIASAVYLGDLGADSAVYSDERNAACRYYSGKSCSGNSNGTSYGNSVMNKAASIQENMIDPLTF